jgi:hypothetical protein
MSPAARSTPSLAGKPTSTYGTSARSTNGHGSTHTTATSTVRASCRIRPAAPSTNDEE